MSERVVSIVLVNYRGVDDTLAAIEALRSVARAGFAVEVVVVDNASGDGSAERLLALGDEIRLIKLEQNVGFAGGCNRGVAASSGDVVAFLNNDARPDQQWLVEAVAVLDRDDAVGCVASKVLDWDGKTVDFVESAMSFYGHGFKLHVGRDDSRDFDVPHDTLFASGAAMVLPRAVFESAGGFDERYFMFFEDVDLGWRLWLLGHTVRYVPSSIVFHRHHASMRSYGPWREHFLLERNALMTIYKNYDERNLAVALPAALALSIRRGTALGGVDRRSLDLAAGGVVPDEPSAAEIPKITMASVYAVDAFVSALPELEQSRREIQSRRTRTDPEVLRLFRLPMHPNIDEGDFVAGFRGVVDALGVDELFTGRRRILVATGDTLQPRMAGPAIRAFRIALELSAEHEVQLVTTNPCDLDHPDFTIRHVDPREMVELEDWCDIIVFQGFLMHQHPVLRFSKKVIVADIYDPFHLEQLEQAKDLGEANRRVVVRDATQVLNEQLQRGDMFLCASAKQRDFWLGQLAALGRINPATYDAHESLEDLIKIVPFGVPDEPAVQRRPAIKGTVPGIGPDDKVVLWGGGIYNWFDPLSLLRAVDKARHELPTIRLFFLGTRHPNPDVPEMRMAVDAFQLADVLGLTGTHVFFNDDWVAYDERADYLLDADIGVSTHLDHVETEFSFRTRILDYLWAELPVVCTAGDGFADLVERHGIGRTVPAGDVDALAAALVELLSDDEAIRRCRAGIPALADQLRWSTALVPLVEFCRDPRRAPDLLDVDLAEQILRPGSAEAAGRTGWRQDLRIIRALLLEGGPGLVIRKALGRVRRSWS